MRKLSAPLILAVALLAPRPAAQPVWFSCTCNNGVGYLEQAPTCARAFATCSFYCFVWNWRSGIAAYRCPDPNCRSEGCPPPLRRRPSSYQELGASSLNAQAVGQLFVVPDGQGGYHGAATVVRGGRTDWDPITFRWGGPGTSPVLDGIDGTAYTQALISPYDEFQLGLDRAARVAVVDTVQGSVIADRATPTSPLGNVQPIQGIGSGFDVQLGVIKGQSVLFWTNPGPAGSSIMVGEVDTDSAAPTFGRVSNPRVAVATSTFPGVVGWHSPTPIDDAQGETRALLCAAQTDDDSSDAYYVSTPDQSQFNVAQVQPHFLHDDGADYLNNPLVTQGTAVYADFDAGAGAYGDPQRLDFFGLSSTTVPSTGGTVTQVAQLPLGLAAPQGVFMSYGTSLAFGCIVAPSVSTGPHPVIGNEASISLTAPPGLPVGAVLSVQAVGLDASNNIWTSNVASIEVGT
ncbi:MAG: hypothetical protein AAF628_20605 [Planctomycetota bacterium]